MQNQTGEKYAYEQSVSGCYFRDNLPLLFATILSSSVGLLLRLPVVVPSSCCTGGVAELPRESGSGGGGGRLGGDRAAQRYEENYEVNPIKIEIDSRFA